jgi:hypothetical protein
MLLGTPPGHSVDRPIHPGRAPEEVRIRDNPVCPDLHLQCIPFVPVLFVP